MSIKDRIRRLEGRGGAGCPECRLKPDVYYVVYPDEDHAPEPERCPRCGRLSDGFVIKVMYEGEGS